MSRVSASKLLAIGIPTVLFSVFGLHTLTSFIEGNNESRALTRLTSRSEREEVRQRTPLQLRNVTVPSVLTLYPVPCTLPAHSLHTPPAHSENTHRTSPTGEKAREHQEDKGTGGGGTEETGEGQLLIRQAHQALRLVT